jgi:hypothetical protein
MLGFELTVGKQLSGGLFQPVGDRLVSGADGAIGPIHLIEELGCSCCHDGSAIM